MKNPADIQHQGFTLIELVMVIVILGVLAAVAMPKFVNLSSDSRVAAIKGLQSAVTSAAMMAHMKCAVTNGCDISALQSGGTITINNVSGQLSYGYPAEASTTPYIRIDQTIDFPGFSFIGTSPAVFTKDSAPNPVACSVTYSKANGMLSVSISTSGC